MNRKQDFPIRFALESKCNSKFETGRALFTVTLRSTPSYSEKYDLYTMETAKPTTSLDDIAGNSFEV
jgi:hypothetical protein